MSAIATLRLNVALAGSEGTLQLSHEPAPLRWAPLVGQRQDVVLTGSAFTALTVPSNASLLVMVLPNTAASLTLKGITGDTGTVIVPASGFKGFPLLLPLGSAPSIGIANGGASVTATLYWL